jgi:capsular exopolysaccharide synthesis family protein
MEQNEQAELSESPFDINEYIYLFKSWAWLIVLSGLVAGAAVYVVSKRTTPIYQASTSLLVSAPSTNSGVIPPSLVTTQTMTGTYSQMLVARPVLQGVIDRLKLQLTPDDLKNFITVTAVTNTQLIVVAVNNTNPALAANIANGIAAVFTDRISQLQSQRFAASRDGLAKQVSEMEGQITDTSNQIGFTTDPATLQQLQARLTTYRTIYSNLVTSYEQVLLADEQASTNVVISEPASIPSKPVSPKTVLNTLLAFLAGLLLSAGIVFASDTLDDTIKNPEKIRKIFKLPVLGVIDSHEDLEGEPIVVAEPSSRTTEAFRSLRTNLIFSDVDTHLCRILVTSPMPQDGKTTIASNLAVVLAQGEKNTLLLDADLRRPMIQMQFGLPDHPGLSDLLIRPLDASSNIVQKVSVPGLSVITSGNLPPNPSELLTSKVMTQFMDRLSQVYDFIVIDSPPLLSVTDATALAPSMDGVILVVKPGATKLGALRQALEQLKTVGTRVLGVVFNEVNPTSRKYGYYFKSHFSNYSYKYQKPHGKQKRSRKSGKTSKVESDKLLRPEPGDVTQSQGD